MGDESLYDPFSKHDRGLDEPQATVRDRLLGRREWGIEGVVFQPAVSVLIDTGLQNTEFWRR